MQHARNTKKMESRKWGRKTEYKEKILKDQENDRKEKKQKASVER